MADALRIVFLGLSITSSWGNGHATNYRALVQALERRSHAVTFLERDVPWYAAHRDLPDPPYGQTFLYGSLEELEDRFGGLVAAADLVVVGSFVPEGTSVGHWVTRTATGITAFYDIDTPVTLAKLERGDAEYLEPSLVPRYDLYLSFTGGPTLQLIEQRYGSPCARPFYCVVDPDSYFPEPRDLKWDLGYLGTYSEDRQPALERLMLEAARKEPDLGFIVAGPQYPDDLEWPLNVERVEHLPPSEHRAFYNAQRFTLNVTRAAMVRAGYSPSVRLFEAAACAVPVITDRWEGLDQFFEPQREILVADDGGDTIRYLTELGESERRRVGERARRRVLAEHTADRRAEELEGHLERARANRSNRASKP